MTTVFLGLITLAVIVAVGAFIFVIIELRNALRTSLEFMKATELALKQTLDELQKALASLGSMAESVSAVADDVYKFSASVRKIGEDAEQVSRFIEDMTSSTSISVSAWKAGLRAGLEVFIRKLLAGKGGN